MSLHRESLMITLRIAQNMIPPHLQHQRQERQLTLAMSLMQVP